MPQPRMEKGARTLGERVKKREHVIANCVSTSQIFQSIQITPTKTPKSPHPTPLFPRKGHRREDGNQRWVETIPSYHVEPVMMRNSNDFVQSGNKLMHCDDDASSRASSVSDEDDYFAVLRKGSTDEKKITKDVMDNSLSGTDQQTESSTGLQELDDCQASAADSPPLISDEGADSSKAVDVPERTKSRTPNDLIKVDQESKGARRYFSRFARVLRKKK
jgi:hypothetical protein